MDKIENIFIKTGLITEKELEAATKEKEKTPWVSISEVLISLNYATDKGIASVLSTQLGLPLVELPADMEVDQELLQLFGVKLANKYSIFPISRTGKILKLAMGNPLDFNAIQAVEFKLTCSISPVVASYADIRAAIERSYSIDEDIEDIINDARYSQGPEFVNDQDDNSNMALNKLKVESQTAPTVRIVNKILQKAARMGASDIHIEAQQQEVAVRYRIDGIMNDIMKLPKAMLNGIVSRIKIIAKLDIAERRIPQDGKLIMAYEGRQFDVRVSTLPTKFGEKVVMRLLNASNSTVSLDEIGLLPSAMRLMLHFSELKQGIVLVTGPTGSGKTTTLYALLKELLKKKLNIVTFEDPIEYQIPGVNQVQINEKKGLTFANGLRSALRQDPDVIMVGEIRDAETLEVALQASITGHLVLSTVHTNDAASTISRIKNLGGENFQISSGLAGIVAQRLVRTICNNCREVHSPKPNIMKQLQAKAGEDFSYTFYKGKGCDKCSNTGYRGRMGVYEVLDVNNSIQSLIVADASDIQIREQAIENGMFTMAMDCIEKLRYGVTTIDELERVFVLDSKIGDKCPGCEKTLTQQFGICPYCSYVLIHICPSCKKEMDPDWNLCPFCRIDLRKPFPPIANDHLLAAAPQQKLLPTEYNRLALPPMQEQKINQNNLSLSAANPPQQLLLSNYNEELMEEIIIDESYPLNKTDIFLPNSNLPTQQQTNVVAERPQYNVLIVEGDEILVIGLQTYLTRENFNVRVARDGFEALESMLAFTPQLVVVDIMTLRMDGYEFIRALRQESSTTFLPVIILSTKDSIEDKILGFTLGIDDYLDKPFSSEELSSRIRTVLRRIYG